MMTRIEDTVANHADDARAEIAALRQKVESLMETRVTPAIGAIAGEAEAAAKAATETVRDQTRRLSDTVREQPLAAIGLATLAGFVLAAVLRR
jgi:ElaB/YqjD/DUF883 family membrane-anchored ribosome-binding protein